MENQPVPEIIHEFKKITQSYSAMQRLLPDSSPEKHPILTKLLEAQFWLKFYIDIMEAEKANPVKMGVSKKPKLEEVHNGNPAS